MRIYVSIYIYIYIDVYISISIYIYIALGDDFRGVVSLFVFPVRFVLCAQICLSHPQLVGGFLVLLLPSSALCRRVARLLANFHAVERKSQLCSLIGSSVKNFEA